MSHTVAALDARDEVCGRKESPFAYQASEQDLTVPCSINSLSIQARLWTEHLMLTILAETVRSELDRQDKRLGKREI